MEEKPKLELLKALALFRDKHDGIFRGTKAYGYKYAEYKDIREKIDPLLKECKLVITHQSIVLNVTNYQRTTVSHWETGQSLHSDIEMKVKKTLPYDDKQKKYVGTVLEDSGDPQGLGAAITYYNRYGLASLLALKLVSDTDGVSSVEDKIINAEVEKQQAKETHWRKRLKSAEILIGKLAEGENIPEKHIPGVKRLYAEMTDSYKQQLALIVEGRGVNFDD